jgi:hypothetical protein
MSDARQNEVMVRLNDDEVARLDEMRPAGVARAVHLRNLLAESRVLEPIADRQEILALLSEQARAGKVAAAVALERALRNEDDGDIDDEIARILGD